MVVLCTVRVDHYDSLDLGLVGKLLFSFGLSLYDLNIERTCLRYTCPK